MRDAEAHDALDIMATIDPAECGHLLGAREEVLASAAWTILSYVPAHDLALLVASLAQRAELTAFELQVLSEQLVGAMAPATSARPMIRQIGYWFSPLTANRGPGSNPR